MPQTATGLLVIGWNLALAIVAGSSVLTTLGVFLLARFTHVFDAYAGERAKLLAQFHNLDRLVEQTKTLTATTEAIRSRITDEAWDRQQRWKARLEYYQSLFRVLSELVESAYHLGWNEALSGPKALDQIMRQLHPTTENQRLTEALGKGNVELRQLLMFGELVVGTRGRICLEHIRQAVKFYRADLGTGETMQRFHERLTETVPKAIAEAKADLGYEPNDDAGSQSEPLLGRGSSFEDGRT
jgi:hypothetical protein